MKVGDEIDLRWAVETSARITKKISEDEWIVTIKRGNQATFDRKVTKAGLIELGFKEEWK